MDNSRRGYHNGPLTDNGRCQRSCDGCKSLSCHSIHGPIAQKCLLEGCYFCADLATIDNQISSLYKRLFDLVQQREKINKKPHHELLIHFVPVEILSLIFVFVKEAYNDDFGKPWFKLPFHSPHILVGAVCKRWRDVALRTPQLWTDVIVDIMAPKDAQINMVTEWACRSGVLPLNITISLKDQHPIHEELILGQCEDVVRTLRSLAVRWNDVTLRAPWSYCHKLLNELEESPSIRSFSYIPMIMMHQLGGLYPIKLQHPLRPERFYSLHASGLPIPFKWDNLVHLEINGIDKGKLFHIILHAQNLRYCVIEMVYESVNEQYPIPTTHITNSSLIHLRTNNDLLAHLTLPSLQHLEYSTFRTVGPPDHIDSLVKFVDRSRPPLQTFTFRCNVWPGELDPCFEKLAGITRFSITVHGQANDNDACLDRFLHTLIEPSAKVILPALTEFTLSLPSMPPLSWLHLSRLFRRDIQQGMMASATLGRLLSKVHIYILDDAEVTLDQDTFLHLLAVRKSGVDLFLQDYHGRDLFSRMAELYDVEL